MALQPAERVEQRQRAGEAGHRAVADVHPDVAFGLQQRPQDLAGQVRADLVAVQPLERDVAFPQPERGPGGLPERDRLAGIGEVMRGGLAEQLRPDPQQPVDERPQVRPAELALPGDGLGVVVSQESLGLDQVGAAADGGQLVGGQVVVHVGDVDAERLAAQEAERDRRAGGLQDQRADPGAVVGHGLAGTLQHVRGVVPHQVTQPVVVLAPVPAIELHELIQPGFGLAPVADTELEDVQLLG